MTVEIHSRHLQGLAEKSKESLNKRRTLRCTAAHQWSLLSEHTGAHALKRGVGRSTVTEFWAGESIAAYLLGSWNCRYLHVQEKHLTYK